MCLLLHDLGIQNEVPFSQMEEFCIEAYVQLRTYLAQLLIYNHAPLEQFLWLKFKRNFSFFVSVAHIHRNILGLAESAELG